MRSIFVCAPTVNTVGLQRYGRQISGRFSLLTVLLGNRFVKFLCILRGVNVGKDVMKSII